MPWPLMLAAKGTPGSNVAGPNGVRVAVSSTFGVGITFVLKTGAVLLISASVQAEKNSVINIRSEICFFEVCEIPFILMIILLPKPKWCDL
jgi:hypothetical protein